MKMELPDVKQYSERIVKSNPSLRVKKLITDVRDNMNTAKKVLTEMGSILNVETRHLPLIVRKAMAERQKLSVVPPGMWEGQCFAGCFSLKKENIMNSELLPEFASREEVKEGEKYGFGIYSMFGHISPDYPNVLKLGTKGIKKKIRERLAENLPQKNRDFLEATLISLAGLENYAARHSQWLRAEAAKSADTDRIEDLLLAAGSLEKCPENPAETFFDACQVTWLIHIALQLVGNHLSIGRPDQFLYPYLVRDLETGRISVERAQELCDCFMMKFNERAVANDVKASMIDVDAVQQKLERRWRERTIYDIGQQRYNVRDELDASIHWLQNIVIGGVCSKTGEDASNLLSAMLLESFRRLKMTNPVVSARTHQSSPEWFLKQIAVTLKTGGGLPAIYNDESIIKAYTGFGFSLEEVRDYANDGCWEIILPGKTDFYFNKINALKCLEWTLNHGRCHIDNRQEVPDQGDPSELKTFEMLYSRLFENLRAMVEAAAFKVSNTNLHRSSIAPTPLLSALMDGPVDNMLDMTDWGSKYVVGGTIAEGLSHLIDSLCAIDHVIYREKRYTISELVDALDNDYKGYEAMRAELDRGPKYGTNNPVADAMGRRLIEDYSTIHRKINEREGKMHFLPGVGTFSWYIAVGEGTGASPDGRMEGTPVASNFSPSAGALKKGITAAIQSFAHMGLDNLPLGSPLDIGMSEKYAEGEEGTTRLVGLIKSFVELNGNMLTISVADTATLLDAQKNPEKHRDLRVRMGGWSAYFTLLSKEQQEHHIRKSTGGFF